MALGGCQKAKVRRLKAGLSAPNYNSKTKPSFALAKKKKQKLDALFHAYQHRHPKRTALKAQLIEELGLPSDTLFIFRWSSEDRPDIKYHLISIYYGTVVLINKMNLCLEFLVRVIRFDLMSTALRESFRFAISSPFLAARSRRKCNTNHTVQALIKAHMHWGWLGGCGWRGGTDAGKSLGMSFFSALLNKVVY